MLQMGPYGKSDITALWELPIVGIINHSISAGWILGLDWQKSRTVEISVGFFFSTSGMTISSLITRGVVKQTLGLFVSAWSGDFIYR